MAGDRPGLLKENLEFYQILHDQNQITHFYFTGLDRVNFLRVHELDRYGDSIDRHTILQAEETGEITSGVELGPLGTLTLRVVLPWRDGGRPAATRAARRRLRVLAQTYHRIWLSGDASRPPELAFPPIDDPWHSRHGRIDWPRVDA